MRLTPWLVNTILCVDQGGVCSRLTSSVSPPPGRRAEQRPVLLDSLNGKESGINPTPLSVDIFLLHLLEQLQCGVSPLVQRVDTLFNCCTNHLECSATKRQDLHSTTTAKKRKEPAL
ncbi:unnamed protein product [Caretta caretta]